MKLPRIQLIKKRERNTVVSKRKLPRFSFKSFKLRKPSTPSFIKSLTSKKLPKISFKFLTWKNFFTFICVLVLIPLTFVALTQFKVWQARAAATIYWDGGGGADTSWENPLNWNTDVIPVPADDVLIDTSSTVNITEPITINSLVIGKSTGTAASILQFSYDAISLGALTISNGNFTLHNGATITHIPAVGTYVASRINIDVQTGNANIYGIIHGDIKGYGPGEGPGGGTNGDRGSGGGAYGGNGGNGQTRAGGVAYGSYLEPSHLGSGGGSCVGGGGAIKLTVAGITTVNGAISVNGGNGKNYGDRATCGAGSGGSVWIITQTLTGTGVIKANGGYSPNQDYSDGGGGGGGRIALYYDNNSFLTSSITANGGSASEGAKYGGAGTIYFKKNSDAYGDLILSSIELPPATPADKTATTPLDNNLTIKNLTIAKSARVEYNSALNVNELLSVSNSAHLTISQNLTTDSLNINSNGFFYNPSTANTTYNSLNWTGGTITDNGGTLELVDSGLALSIPQSSTLIANVPRTFSNITISGILTHDPNSDSEANKLNYTSTGNITINAGGEINVDVKGYGPGEGPGGGTNGDRGSGGGAYGGNGGDGQTRAGGLAYGSYLEPSNLGSGGGSCVGGGGAIKLTAAGTTTVNGLITANGGNGKNYADRATCGAGSGGSVWIITQTLAGTGIIRSNGGYSPNQDFNDGGGGGGGRIALHYNNNSFTTSSITANGGSASEGAKYGGAGTIYLKNNSDTYGDLILSTQEPSLPSADRTALTPLGNNLTIKNLTITKSTRVVVEGTINATSSITLSNKASVTNMGTVTTDVLNIKDEGYYDNQLNSTITYSSINWTGGILSDNGGTMNLLSGGGALIIPATTTLAANIPRSYSSVTINGTLTHDPNSTADINKINYTVSGNLTLNTGGSINADSKGYTFTNGPGKGADSQNEGSGGGAYGGNGGRGQGAVGGTAYGSYLLPIDLGSGGGNTEGKGASGGGAIKLTVTGTTTVAGTITANGQIGDFGGSRRPGGGSGGSILINTGILAGGGIIRANGGQSSNWERAGGPGGGGRIALYYTTDTSTFSNLTANGARPVGATYEYGGAGTIYKKAASATNGDLIITNNETSWYEGKDNLALTPLPNTLNLDNLTVAKYARVDYAGTMNITSATILSYNTHLTLTGSLNTNSLNITNDAWYYNQLNSTTTYSSINWTGGILSDNGGTMNLVSGGGTLTIPTTSKLESNVPRTFTNVTVDGVLTHTANWDMEVNKINYTISGNLIVNGQINTDGRGYGYTLGPGKGYNTDAGASGASHAGVGGRGRGMASVSETYGDYLQPITLGSGGGRHGASTVPYGGGAIKLTVSGTTTVNGTISADGVYGNGVSDRADGGGAGGSIWITTNTLTGTGIVKANGGNSRDTGHDGGGGGGGRIALYYNTNTSNLTSLSAKGGSAGRDAQHAGAGTIFTKANSATNGDLLISNQEASLDSIYGISSTDLVNTLAVDNLTVSKFARVEYSSNLNVVGTTTISNSAEFQIIGSLNTNILNLTNSAIYYNELTATTTYSSYDWVGGNLYDNGGIMDLISGGGDLTIPQTTTLVANVPRTFTNITVNGLLTHSYNGSEALYKIDYTSLGILNVTSTGQINVDSRGYATGQGPGKGNNSDGGAGGASHAGIGGDGRSALGGTVIYGDEFAPEWLGSGGGKHGASTGTAGGGAIKLTVSGITTVNGTISASGAYGNGHSDRSDGGGAGGSIWIITDTLKGNGDVRANGGSARDTGWDGGGGGGGRIAFYFGKNDSVFTTLTANGGSAGNQAQGGANGTIFLGGLPSNPITLRQFKQDAVTGIGENGSTNENTVILTYQVQDANASDTLTPEVEFVPIGTDFNNIATNVGDPVAYSGTIVTVSIPVTGLADGSSYHWQARACDSTNLCSKWVSFGNNTEAEADIRVVMNTAPNSPTIPGTSYYINGQYTNYLQPTFDFVLNDPNPTDTIGYQIQVDDDSEFASPTIDYISAMSAQGVQSFKVGQTEGQGSYNTGSEGQELSTGEYYWRIKAIDDKGSQSNWTVAEGTPAFKIDLSKPTNASNVRMKASLGSLHEYTESENDIWFNRNDLYFKWDEGTDLQGVKGYCLYLGPEELGNPAVEKGLLGTSPISTTGSTCDFITSDLSIDFVNSALRSYEWLTSSNEKYYFKVKTIDVANNIYEGPDVTNFISFKFDNTPPQNVTAISAPSSVFSSTSEMFFTWPVSPNNSGSDLHSQVLGFQYALNTKDTWYGDSMDENTGLVFKSLDSEQPFFLPQNIRNLIQLGQNTLFFRVLDNAGNKSELRTVYINYGGEAPKFADGEQVTVTPAQSDSNSFAFSWPEAIVSEGNEIETYYYMINTPVPTSYSTITSNSATYIATTETSIAKNSVNGLRKGANTINVVAIDKAHNYSSSNYITATFHLNTELPDPPTNLIIADSSIKDVSMWRAALIWDDPVYKGTGTLTYVIQRSQDALVWETIKTTTGLAHIDTVPESKAYYWRVGTMDNSDQSISHPSYSNAVTIIPRGKYTIPPILTSGPAASSITTTKSTLSWTTNRSADSKIAFGLASGNYLEWEPSISTHTTEHLIPLSNLSPGTEYFYVAKWTDEDGNTGISDEQTFVTQPPPEVKDVRISNLGISSTIINFTTKNASRVKIYYGTSTSFGGIKEIGTSKLETSYSVEIDKLEDGTKYFYQINTFDEEGEEYTGTILDFQTLPRPKVSNILVQQVAKTALSTLLVTWESNTKVSSVVTFYPEKNPELMQDIVELELVQGEHKMLVKGLLPDTVYILRVRGKDIIGNEALSENIRITTSSDSRPPLISAMNIEGANILQSEGTAQSTSSQLIVTWTTDEPSTSQVEYGEGSAESYSQLTQEDRNLSFNHVVIISGLTPSKVYHLRAISKDAAENESRSIDTVTITPKATDSAFYLVITTLQEAFNFLGNL